MACAVIPRDPRQEFVGTGEISTKATLVPRWPLAWLGWDAAQREQSLATKRRQPGEGTT